MKQTTISLLSVLVELIREILQRSKKGEPSEMELDEVTANLYQAVADWKAAKTPDTKQSEEV